ncbi:class I SAM-dependent methyltransferase [Candidatus Sumerlaeota bacterium]|nr:class I SAM-dependent methyltransferase [Candidatus Sumerlaeota bacterium]
MHPKKRSHTAEAVAALRAAHLTYDGEPKILNDPYAALFPESAFFRWQFVPHWAFRALSRRNPHLAHTRSQVVARARYAEDCLAEAMARGTRQYVILGAGLDSFALRRRDLADRLTVYEVDHPASQDWKRERLAANKLDPPANLRFVAVDFERQKLSDELGKSGFDPAAPAFVSWLGTTYYLTRPAIGGTFDTISGWMSAGTELALDYSVPITVLDAAHQRARTRTMRFTERHGEPLITFFQPAEMAAELAAHRFELIEDLGPAGIFDRYFAGREDKLPVSPYSHFLHARSLKGDGG